MKRLLVVLFAFVCLFGIGRASANEGIGLSPAIKEVTLSESDSSVSFDLELFNKTLVPVELGISFLDFGSLDESGGIAFIGRSGQESTAYGLKKWMSSDKQTVKIDPGKSDIVKVTITNGGDLSPGGHYAAVVVTPKSENTQELDSVSVLPASSSLVLLKKQGGENYNLKLDSQESSSSLIRLPNQTKLKFENTGNIHVVPRGTVELVSPSGKTISRGVINESSAYVLPGSKRNFQVELSEKNLNPWLPGRYKLVTTWRHDETDQTTITTTYHWYIGKFLLTVLIVLIVVCSLVTYIRYRRRPATRS